MESIEQTVVEPGLERDLSGLDAIPTPEAPESANDLEVNSEQGEQPGLAEIAKKRARSILKAIEKGFRFKMPGFAYTEEKYEQAESELAPLLEKYDIVNSGPLKYSEEFDAVTFLGGTVVESIQAVQADRAEREEKERNEKRQPAQVTTLGVESGEQSKPFTTQ